MKPVELSGTVEKYSGNGRKLGYPTANISTDIKLKDGVYFGFASLGKYKNHPAIIFIGVPTTVGDIKRRVEAHLLDIEDKDYYGQKLASDIRHFHRRNYTFKNAGKLKDAMQNDETKMRKWLEEFDK